jgi:MFS family permease
MTNYHESMTVSEQRAALALAGILSTRMLGLFMILPVFALYAHTLPNVTPTLVGLAIGIYGLTQAIFQIPLGILSDRFGRKPIITVGLVIFALGSLIAALSSSIIGIIIGRALQGSGAVSSAILALTADLTREEHRTKAMAFLGSSMGISFTLALILGPTLNQWIGVPGIFGLTALLSLIALAVLYLIVPQPLTKQSLQHTESIRVQFKQILTNTQLLRLNIGILLLHFFLTSLFVVLPIVLKAKLDLEYHWQVYVPVLVSSFLVIVPVIIYAEKRQLLKPIFVSAITLLVLGLFGLSYLYYYLSGIIGMLLLFFIAFNLLEASLPSLLSKIAPAEYKGAAMGIYSTAQFLGAFLGGFGGGWLHHHYGIKSIFIVDAILATIWLILAITAKNPRYLSSHLLNIGQLNKQQANQLSHCLTQVPGVAEVVIILEEGVAYLKVDRQVLDMTALNNCYIKLHY